MAAPCVLIASCSELSPEEIAKQILKKEELPESVKDVDCIKTYPWHVDTKYYTADVRLATTNTRTIGDEAFAESVQAFIVGFDSRKKESFEKVKSWLPFLDQIDPEIKMLLCERCGYEDAIGRQKVVAWCVDNTFELVETNPEDCDDEEDDFADSYGIQRVVQALHAHAWPNIQMKAEPEFRSPYMVAMMKEEAKAKAEQAKATATPSSEQKENQADFTTDTSGTEDKAVLCNAEKDSRTDSQLNSDKSKGDSKTNTSSKDDGGAKETASSAERIDSMLSDDEARLISALGNEDESGEESFEQLFSRMKVMTEKAQSLPPDQRKAYAEQVTMAFWKAIGGDEEEIAGLTEEDIK